MTEVDTKKTKRETGRNKETATGCERHKNRLRYNGKSREIQKAYERDK